MPHSQKPVGWRYFSLLAGGALQGWYAPDLTANPHSGLGKWSEEDIVSYLRSGTNKITASSGPMTEAIENSTQYMTDDDLKAIAQYLKALPASEAPAPTPLSSDNTAMMTGKKCMNLNAARAMSRTALACVI